MKIAIGICVIILLIGAAIVTFRLRSRAPQVMPQFINEGMKELAELAVGMADNDYSIKLDYSVDSVKLVEDILSEIYMKHSRNPLSHKQVTQAATRYGAYIGEVIRRKWGGFWQKDHNVAGPDSFPVNSDGHESFPIGWCYKRITNGSEDNVWIKLQMLYLKDTEGGITFHPDGTIEEH